MLGEYELHINHASKWYLLPTWIITYDTISILPLRLVVIQRLEENLEHGNEKARQECIVDNVEDGNLY